MEVMVSYRLEVVRDWLTSDSMHPRIRVIENFDDYKKEWISSMDKQIELMIQKRFEKKKKKDDFDFSKYVDSNNFTMSF
jgi:hypothetical protein